MIKILFLAANPKDTDSLRLGEEAREIKERIQLSDLRDQFVFEQEHAVRVADLQRHLLHHQPHIVHFSGHGSTSGKIILENPQGQSVEVSPTALADLFAALKDNIRCVVLNACYSDAQAAGIAKSIECVIGMGRAVDDNSAIAFAASFYQGLGHGRSIQTAFDLGRNQIDISGLPGDDIPKLKTRRGVKGSGVYLLGDATIQQVKDSGGAAKHSVPSSTSGASEHYSVFISYSTKDAEFVTKLRARLTAEGVKVWLDRLNMQGGKKLHEQIESAVGERDKLLLVLSPESMNSNWVDTEIRTARNAELAQGKRKLFPIRLVDMPTIKKWKCFDADSGKDLAIEVREFFIPDFSKWTDHDSFEAALVRLLGDLRADDPSPPYAPSPKVKPPVPR